MSIDKLLKKLRCYDSVSAVEEAALRSAVAKEVHFEAGATIVRSKTEVSCSNLLLEGFVHRYKDLKSGARQTLQLGVPGDFLDLHGLLLKQLDHDLAAMSDCRLALFPHDRLRELIASHEHLGRLLWLSTVVDAAIHREWMLSLGIRSAISRLAHLFCELCVRLDVAGSVERCSYPLPLTQSDLGEMLGMTPVHVNRMLKKLRGEGLVTFRRKLVKITDWDGLAELGEFDPFYLSMRQRPR